MLRAAVRTASALVVFVAVAAAVSAQPPQPAQPKGAQPGHAVRAKSVLGAKVTLQGGAGVGTVEDIVMNDEGVVDYLIVSEAGKLVTVPWDAVKFNFEKRMAVIDIPAEKFQKIPTYTVEQYPNFYAPTYRTEVYRWYGITPGQERRLERRLNK